MSKYKVDITGINTSEIPVLSGKESIELFQRMNSGDALAKQELIYGNLRLVLSILQRFNKTGVNMDDLFQVGVMGLIKAIDNFDLSYNLQLSTYAVPLILGEIRRYLRDNTSFRVSRSLKDLAYRVIKFKDEYTIEHGVIPTTQIIAEHLEVEEFDISYALDSLKDPVSIFEPIYNDGGDPIYLEDKIADVKDNPLNQDMLISLRKALISLKNREREILIKRYIIGETQSEIAELLGISQAQVSRIEKNAIKNVRKLV